MPPLSEPQIVPALGTKLQDAGCILQTAASVRQQACQHVCLGKREHQPPMRSGTGAWRVLQGALAHMWACVLQYNGSSPQIRRSLTLLKASISLP